jgi:uncharacterized protein (TIGR00369 family)
MAEINTERRSFINLEQEGWSVQQPYGFVETVGPLWERRDERGLHLGIVSEAKHLNRSGVMHGGAILTFADQALGTAAWEATGYKPQVTIQLDVQFVSAVEVGEFVTAQCQVVRVTGSLVFLRGVLLVGSRTIATASGVWKYFRRVRDATSQSTSA